MAGEKNKKKFAAPIEERMRCLKRVGKWGEKKRDLKAYFLLSEGIKTKGILSAGAWIWGIKVIPLVRFE